MNTESYNPELTLKFKENDKYRDLLAWGLANGVKIRGVDLPAAFGQHGLSGVVATQDLPPMTGVIAVPYSLVISQEKCKLSPLKEIYIQYPDLFDEEECTDAEFNLLIFYLYWEKQKGYKSFYYPYIQAIQGNNTLLEWTDEQLKTIEDPLLLQDFYIVRDDMLVLWQRAENIIAKNTHLFMNVNKNDFYWAAQSVMSRCFGWSLKSTSMVPIADFLNHSNCACTHYMVHSEIEAKHQEKPEETVEIISQYKLKSSKLDLSILGIQSSIDLKEVNDPKVEYIKKNMVFLEDNTLLDLQRNLNSLELLSSHEKRVLINQINYTTLEKYQKQIWDLGFATSSDSEDNDSDEEVEGLRNKQFSTLKAKEEKEIQSRKSNTVTVILNEKHKNPIKITGLPSDQIDAIRSIQQSMIRQPKEEQQEEEAEESDSSEESKWDWLNEDDKNAYFVITTTQALKKDEQVTVSYGRRTNRFLLSWYGFALQNNKYSSFNFRLWLNLDAIKNTPNTKDLLDIIVIQKIITQEEWDEGFIFMKGNKLLISQITKEFRLKKHQLNQDLLMYLRLYLMVYYSGKDVSDILITIPVSIAYEIFVLQFTVKLLNYFLNQYTTSLNDDNHELETDIPYWRRFAIYINREKKEILMQQILIILEAIVVLKRVQEGKKLKEAYMELDHDPFRKMENLRALKKYLKSINDYI